jgi:glycosyltransferase involved in cell wall biosynthesis
MKKSSDEKIKIVWLCHFSNSDLQELLKPRKKVPEYAPWIKSMIRMFENDDTVEVHVVAQHEHLTFSKSFKSNGIHFHIIRKGIPLLGRRWPRFFKLDRLTDFAFWKWKVKKVVNRIQPDLIHLHGFENEFCGAILQFKGIYPVFITIQGFINHSKDQSETLNYRKANELKIIETFDNFGVRTKTMETDIRALNPKAQTFWHQYPMKIPSSKSTRKNYDVVFFARITKDKGIEDLIKAIKIVVEDFNYDLKACIIGGGNYAEFESLANDLGISNNIEWKGFLPTQQDVYDLAAQARISVLPTYHDIVSGTIIESLFLKVPVVAYDTGSIHEVNEHEPIIALVEKYNIQELAKSIHSLLGLEENLEERAEKGYKRVYEMFGESDEQIKEKVIAIYKDVIIKKVS